MPRALTGDDQDEYCQLVAVNNGCADFCGYKWNAVQGECVKAAAAVAAPAQNPLTTAPIIGGSGKFRYQYMPDRVVAPAGASLVNCHGLVTDADNNIYLTYQNDGKDKHCLIKWKPDGTGGEFASKDSDALCSGTPHGLKITTEKTDSGTEQFLYHANNNQKLTKTKLDGTIVWQVNGLFGQDTTVYRPTWFGQSPRSYLVIFFVRCGHCTFASSSHYLVH